MDTKPGQLPVLVVHGGAWSIPEALTEASKAGVVTAVREGYRVLQGGGTAVDAVEAAVRALEDDPAFDAGGETLKTQGFMVRLMHLNHRG